LLAHQGAAFGINVAVTPSTFVAPLFWSMGKFSDAKMLIKYFTPKIGIEATKLWGYHGLWGEGSRIDPLMGG
jgi:hypothetical protein